MFLGRDTRARARATAKCNYEGPGRAQAMFFGSGQARRGVDDGWRGSALAVWTFLGSLVLLHLCQIFFKLFFVRENRSEIRFDSSPFASIRQALLRLQQVF